MRSSPSPMFFSMFFSKYESEICRAGVTSCSGSGLAPVFGTWCCLRLRHPCHAPGHRRLNLHRNLNRQMEVSCASATEPPTSLEVGVDLSSAAGCVVVTESILLQSSVTPAALGSIRPSSSPSLVAASRSPLGHGVLPHISVAVLGVTPSSGYCCASNASNPGLDHRSTGYLVWAGWGGGGQARCSRPPDQTVAQHSIYGALT